VDFQHRADPFYQETVKRLHQGALGTLTFGEVYNHSGEYDMKAKPGTPEARLKNWLCYKALSGDYMVEINIHTVDMMNWMFQKPPLYAVGSGGRRAKRRSVTTGIVSDFFISMRTTFPWCLLQSVITMAPASWISIRSSKSTGRKDVCRQVWRQMHDPRQASL
jgi:predicted dehydrogenase